MDAARFADLLRALAASPSRRRVTRGFLSLAVVTPLGALLGPGATEAKKRKKKKKKCKPRCDQECQVCKKGKCQAKSDGTTCSTGFCQGGACSCPPGQVCALAELCCPEPVQCGGGTCICVSADQLCSIY